MVRDRNVAVAVEHVQLAAAGVDDLAEQLHVAALDDHLVTCDRPDALDEESIGVARIGRHDDLARARRSPKLSDEKPIAVPERRLHAVAGDGDPEQRRRRSHFLVAQKMSAISLTAACRSAAAFASTLCLFFEQSFAAFQKVSCSFGYFSRCSGLK